MRNSEVTTLPKEEANRFESEYQAWLLSGKPYGEFSWERGKTRFCIRFDQIVKREIEGDPYEGLSAEDRKKLGEEMLRMQRPVSVPRKKESPLW
ncbi:MAG TPA: hypothetical protein VKU00_12190 [Chthonomonadaceae bacterium]|nr:hypothetical protein [Chthonomonadaceae bacterium]